MFYYNIFFFFQAILSTFAWMGGRHYPDLNLCLPNNHQKSWLFPVVKWKYPWQVIQPKELEANLPRIIGQNHFKIVFKAARYLTQNTQNGSTKHHHLFYCFLLYKSNSFCCSFCLNNILWSKHFQYTMSFRQISQLSTNVTPPVILNWQELQLTFTTLNIMQTSRYWSNCVCLCACTLEGIYPIEPPATFDKFYFILNFKG